MFYSIEIVRDENKDVIARNILSYSTQPIGVRGKEIAFINDVERDLETTKVSVDQDGNLYLEDDTDKLALQASEYEIAMRVQRIQFGQRLVAIMSIRNDAKSLTTEQIVQLVSDFADINQAWLNGSIQTSRALIDALTPDETILTTADKTAILAEIDANLTALGY